MGFGGGGAALDDEDFGKFGEVKFAGLSLGEGVAEVEADVVAEVVFGEEKGEEIVEIPD